MKKPAITKKPATMPTSRMDMRCTLPIIPKKPESTTPISTALFTRAKCVHPSR